MKNGGAEMTEQPGDVAAALERLAQWGRHIEAFDRRTGALDGPMLRELTHADFTADLALVAARCAEGAAEHDRVIEECAQAAARFAENYPAAVFSAADSRELVLIADNERLRFLSDRLGADMARRTSANIAHMLRSLLPPAAPEEK